MTATLRIGLTGGIGSGKSTVASKFQEFGVPVIDSDVISRDIVSPGKPCLKLIANEFGESILNDKEELNREKLRTIIFDDDVSRKKLEEILHPAIYSEIENHISKVKYPYCLIVVPLLIETNAIDRFDRILVVDANENLQVERASNRDKAINKDIKKIIRSQVPQEKRLKYADDVINNNVTIEELNSSILKLHKKYLKLSN